HCNVLKLDLDISDGQATGVTYVDTQERAIGQPPKLVLSCSSEASDVYKIQMLSCCMRKC
ncbi:hypothetical protein Q2384_24550, partial [Escherichia coli]|nr:hypothetical protein [Escherichia coli]